MKKNFIFIALFILVGLVVLFVWQELTTNDGKLHVVFCNVGQGDGIFIRTPKNTDILIDGGPDRKVLDCLTRHMPFWDRRLELVILSHPHQDHFAGLIDVIEDYSIDSFVSEKLVNKSAGFRAFESLLSEKNVATSYVFAGDRIRTEDDVLLHILGPSRTFLEKTSPSGSIGESSEFGSLVIKLSYGDFDVLLTSDSQTGLLKEALGQLTGTIEVLQVPHHGSRFGLDDGLVTSLDPKLAVISVGKNTYGHPTDEVIRILKDKDIKILRTDQNGEIEIISSGKTYQLGISKSFKKAVESNSTDELKL